MRFVCGALWVSSVDLCLCLFGVVFAQRQGSGDVPTCMSVLLVRLRSVLVFGCVSRLCSLMTVANQDLHRNYCC
jgi:hypothetical protein